MKVLVIEDNKNIIDTITSAFELDWPEVRVIAATSGSKGLQLVEEESPDVVILDLGLPDIDGLDVLKQIRLFSPVPVLILTVRANESDVVRGLSKGADDYMVKPFSQLELLARIKAITRRYRPAEEDLSVKCGPLSFGSSVRELHYRDRQIRLTKTEGLIFYLLVKDAGRVVSLDTISERVWGREYKDTADSIRVYIHRLREKLEESPDNPKIIISHPAIGYSLAAPEE